MAMVLFAPPPRVLPYFGYRNERRLVLTARALRSKAPEWNRTTTLAKMRTLFSHFASHEVAELAVTLAACNGRQEQHASCRTDAEGFCHFDMALEGGWQLPERTSWETVTLRWRARGQDKEATGHILAPGRDHRLAIVSDIDDTILETGAHDLFSNWRRVLAQMPGERQPVPGSAELYASLGGSVAGEQMPATERPFFYVSSSPWNLFDYLLAFNKAHGLPHGPMFLRDWGFNRATLGRGSHGAHKTSAILDLLQFFPETRFALIGDSTQADALAFAEVVRQHPDRIAGVLIRKAPGADVNEMEQAAFAEIESARVPLWLGESFATDRSFLTRLGLAGDSEVEAVVQLSEDDDTASSPVQAERP